MKKFILSSFLLCSTVANFAGGLITNSNQSASYTRMLSRFGSTEIDAVYYNPAGLVLLKDGWNVSLNNQFLNQTRTVSSNYPTLNGGNFKEYEGKVNVPFFPNVYAAYKKGNFVYSLGINPIGGGGASEFKNGLPMFEEPISALSLLPSAVSTGAYSVDMDLKGSSIYLGYQAGISYKANDIVALFGGIRAVQATNSYEGNIKNIQISNVSGSMVNAQQYLTSVGIGMQQSPDPVTKATGAALVQKAEALGDKSLEVTQTGFGFTPIIGVNFNFTEKLNLGFRYEFETKIELENDTKKDDVNMFPDGAKSRADMPATLSVGAEYKIFPKLKLALGGQYYFDKGANYNGREAFIDDNSWEASFGAEYNITDKILVSAGYLHFENGVSSEYQSQISHTVSTNTIGLGGAYKFNQMFTVNLGAFYSIGETYKVDQNNGVYSYQTKYGRTNLGIGIGVDMHF